MAADKTNSLKVRKRTKGLSQPRHSTHCKDGVDLTLIDWMLSLTPVERLKVAQENGNAILRLRRANPKLSFPAPEAAKKAD
jgi:hypothetical protein